jgi:hypothetical protein
MKKIFFIISILTGIFSGAQTAAKWENVYGQGGNEYGYRVRTCLGQGYIMAGSSSSSGISDGYLVRVDSLGLVMWSKYFAGNNVDVIRSIRQLPDSGFVLAGYSNSNGTNGGYDGWALRTDKNGDTVWVKYIGTTDWDFFYDVALTYDGGFIFSGGTYGTGAGDEDMYFVKTDANGDTLWTKTYGGIKADEARSVCETGDSLLAAAGFSYSLGDSLGDSWVLRMNAVGDTIWSKTMNTPTVKDEAYGIACYRPYSRLFIVGQTGVNGNPDAYLNCIDYTSAQLYTITFGQAPADCFYGVGVNAAGTVAAIGTTFSFGGGNGDMYFFNDKSGWFYTTYGSLLEDGGYSIDFTNDGGYIACGYTLGFNSVLPNAFLVKMDTSGNSSGILNVREQPAPLSFGSTSIFPNPGNTDVLITYDGINAINGDLQMEIYDISGRLVEKTDPSKWQMTGAKNATCSFSVQSFGNGIYQYVISDRSGGKCSGKFVVAH